MSQVEEKKVGLGKNRKKFPEKNFNPLNFYEMNEITYHTRHIPEEHLDLSKNAAKVIKGNGLCDALDIDNLRFLKKQGVDTIELRLVWWELETSPEHFSWSRFERDLNKVRNAGFKAGLMAWLNYPPPWYLK